MVLIGVIGCTVFLAKVNTNAVGGSKSVTINVSVATCKVTENAFYSSSSPYWNTSGPSLTVTSQNVGAVSKSVSGSYSTRTKTTLKRSYTVNYLDYNYNQHKGTGSITWSN